MKTMPSNIDKYTTGRFRTMTGLLEPKFAEKKKVAILDIGGNTGDYFAYLINNGFTKSSLNYNLIDFDPVALKIAHKRGITTYQHDIAVGSINSIVKGKFDIIICTEVLEHLLDPKKLVTQFSGLLRPGGLVLISLPNENGLFHRIYVLIGLGIDQLAFEPHKHHHFPTISQSRIFLRTYFKILSERYFLMMSGENTRFGFLAGFLHLFPDRGWSFLMEKLPNLFARGTIFLCRPKKTIHNYSRSF